MQIKLLEETVINKIAAGEVIERPASIVKELVENAIDASATHIIVELEEGGKSRIKVIDNGHGMNKDDAQLCIQRHTTSKIRTAEDLFNIHSLGFRGEGLASIVAVSNMKIETKDKNSITGIRITCEDGKINHKEEIAMPDGSAIEVTNLFYNVPVRKKHLKTIQTELRKITELMTKYAVIYPDKCLRLLHHDNELLFSPPAEPHSNLLGIFGKKITDALLPIEYCYGDIAISGFIGQSTLTRADKSLQYIFINTRSVQNYIIAKAVHDAYHTLLHLDREPVFFLNVTIEPSIIDVNVHPQKTTIRIEKESELYNVIFIAVRDTLDKARLMPVVQEKNVIQAPLIAKQFIPKHEQQTAFVAPETYEEKVPYDELRDSQETKAHETTVSQYSVAENEKISSLKLLGCIHKLFYIAENEFGLVIIDQHAAHERVLYEQFMRQHFARDIPVQQLLHGEYMDFSPTEMLVLSDNLNLLKGLGFVFESFGGNTMLLRSIPSIFGKYLPKEVIYDILGQIDDTKNAILSAKEEKIIRSACRSAVKAHDVVHAGEMQKILTDLGKCKQPFTCPHGRPTMIQFSIPELERKFKRVV